MVVPLWSAWREVETEIMDRVHAMKLTPNSYQGWAKVPPGEGEEEDEEVDEKEGGGYFINHMLAYAHICTQNHSNVVN